MCSIFTLKIYPQITEITPIMQKRDKLVVDPGNRFSNLCNLRNLWINHRLNTAPIDGTAEVTILVLYFSRYLRRSSVSG